MTGQTHANSGDFATLPRALKRSTYHSCSQLPSTAGTIEAIVSHRPSTKIAIHNASSPVLLGLLPTETQAALKKFLLPFRLNAVTPSPSGKALAKTCALRRL